MEEILATSWGELQDLLFQDSWNANISRFRSNYAFRGLNDAKHTLSTSLMRMGNPYPKMEQNLLKQFQKYAHKHVVERDTEWHWLSIAQHHGLPTRLLDWTYSPYVALHFATSSLNDFKCDGAIWMVNFVDTHSLLQAAERSELQNFGANIFSMDMLVRTIPDINTLDNKHSSAYDAAIFFEPPTIDERIINQFAYFSVLSNPNLTFDDWLQEPYAKDRVRSYKITIPARLKWEIRDKLDQANINERILMPGLDGLCAWLKRHYTPT
ncbi:FRG domain-containing protein [Azospirillum sp. B4]|uniref:FRG domain-containing protein n=1 Tax=Azospirillum sp. B4 TaxID=95605 RepID=UPI000A0470CA|nr:FRG domain-containing protein [Azospirillum sp. B4]